MGRIFYNGKPYAAVNAGLVPIGFEKVYFGTIIPDTYISNTNGQEIPYGGWSSTDYISISGNEMSVDLVRDDIYNAFYDSEKHFISSFNTYNMPITIPSNAKYVRFSLQTGNISPTTYLFCGSES